MKFQSTAKMIALLVLSLISVCTDAGMSNEKLLKILLDNGTITQEQFDDLMKLVSEEELEARKKAEDDVKVSLKGGRLKVKTADDAFRFQAGGLIAADTAWYSADDNVVKANDWGNGTEIRYARLFILGKVWNHWNFKLQYDFEGPGALKDASLEYTGLRKYTEIPLNIKVGFYKEPFSLEELTMAKFTTFMERALPNAMAPSRNVGVQLASSGGVYQGGWTAAAGWFTGGVIAENDNGNDESNAFAGRLTIAPWAAKTQVLHFGGAVEYRNYDNSSIRIRSRPEAHTAEHRMVDTGDFTADSTLKWGAELAGVYGPLSVQGEYIYTHVNNYNGTGAEANLNGWYGFASWLLTGESRSYQTKFGVFGRIKPKGVVGRGGWGAWELVGRYSNIDLTDGPIQGYKENDITIGLNWYATPTVRFMANYIIADSDNPKFNDPDIFQMRGQIDF